LPYTTLFRSASVGTKRPRVRIPPARVSLTLASVVECEYQHAADERRRPHNDRSHRLWRRVFPRGDSDALAAVRPRRAGPTVDAREDARRDGAGGHRSWFLH